MSVQVLFRCIFHGHMSRQIGHVYYHYIILPCQFVGAFGSRRQFVANFFAAVVKNTCSRPGWVCTRRRSGHKVLSTTCIKHRQHIGRLWISKIVPAECMKGWWRIIWACAVNAQRLTVTFSLDAPPFKCAFGMASLIMNTLNYHLQASAAMNPEESWYRDILLREQIMSDNLRY